MSSDPQPFAAIIGGFYNLDSEQYDAAKKVGKLIGQELAKAGFGLVVYFSNEMSLEPHVVSGYVTQIGKDKGAIRVRYSRSQRGQVKFAEEASVPDIFDHKTFPSDDWEEPFYQSLAEDEGVDAVLLVAGGVSTLIAGHIAVARKLPVLAIDQFGGSAEKIWSHLAQASSQKNIGSWRPEAASKLVGELRSECLGRALSKQQWRKREALLATILAKRQRSVWTTGSFVALLMALYFGMVHLVDPALYPFVILTGLVAAGATGALARLLMAASDDGDPRTSLVLGSIAGFVVGLAYLIPQWVGAPGVLEAKGAQVSATDKIQFASAVLVALSAGIGFDTVFGRLRQQAEKVPIGP